MRMTRNVTMLCTARAKQTGQRCSRYKVIGEDRCHMHLGKRMPDEVVRWAERMPHAAVRMRDDGATLEPC